MKKELKFNKDEIELLLTNGFIDNGGDCENYQCDHYLDLQEISEE